MRHEVKVIRHLATKVPPGAWDWRPTPGQRSMLELLRYLTVCGSIGTTYAASGTWARAEELEKEAESVTPETFDAAMARQMALLEEVVRSIPEEDLLARDAKMPWGAPTKLGIGLIDMGLKPLTAYRMQFFLYAKQAGNAALGPANCWVGIDPPKPA
jgi:hypothetical protein